MVGAPQYFEREGGIGGAAYVYINQEGKWDRVKPIRLNGAKDSMFGIAVENVGDVNKDGFPGKQERNLYVLHGFFVVVNIQQLAQIIQKPESNIMLNPYSLEPIKCFFIDLFFLWFIYHFYIPRILLTLVNRADIIKLGML